MNRLKTVLGFYDSRKPILACRMDNFLPKVGVSHQHVLVILISGAIMLQHKQRRNYPFSVIN
jgi:hypothetical protein